MHGGMAMNYGGMRGMGSGPMPQRQGNNRRNYNRNPRNSRFDQAQNFNQNRNPPQQNQNNRGNVVENRQESTPNAGNVVNSDSPVPTPTPAVVPQQTTKPPQAAVPAVQPQVQPQVAQQPPIVQQAPQKTQRQSQPQQQTQQQPQQQPQPQQQQIQQQQQPQQRPQQNQQQRSQQPQQQQRPQQQQQRQQQQQQPQQQAQQAQQVQQQAQQQQPQQQQNQSQLNHQQQPQTHMQQNSRNSGISDVSTIQTINSLQNQQGQNQQHYQNRPNNQYNRQGGNMKGGAGGIGGGGFKRQMQDNKGSLGGSGGGGGNREEHMIVQKLRDIAGPTVELPPLDQEELRFSGRSRLYVGNLTNDITDQEFQEMFAPYGETAELFINKEKNFAFIRIDYRANAEKARRELDGSMRKGRALRVRFAPHNSAIKVSNLTPQVSNELLHKAFEVFGKIERSIVKADDRGKSLCEGIVEFARKAGAMTAIRYCNERCYFITSSLRPVIVEPFDEIDEVDGYPEKSLPKKNPDYLRAREVGPRFADLNSFEHEYGTRWKQLHELYRQKEEALKAELIDERDKLEAQMELARYEQETEMLRETLRRREAERERAAMSWRVAGERREADRETARANVLRTQDDLTQRMRLQDDELRRRQQENTLFMQAQQLNSMLDQQEQGIGGTGAGSYDDADAKRGFIDQGLPSGAANLDGGYLDHGRQYGSTDRPFEGDLMGRWRHDDFPNKRRRY